MPQLLGIRLFNFKGLKDITLGKLRNNNAKPLTNLSVVIGKNGAGKAVSLKLLVLCQTV